MCPSPIAGILTTSVTIGKHTKHVVYEGGRLLCKNYGVLSHTMKNCPKSKQNATKTGEQASTSCAPIVQEEERKIIVFQNRKKIVSPFQKSLPIGGKFNRKIHNINGKKSYPTLKSTLNMGHSPTPHTHFNSRRIMPSIKIPLHRRVMGYLHSDNYFEQSDLTTTEASNFTRINHSSMKASNMKRNGSFKDHIRSPPNLYQETTPLQN